MTSGLAFPKPARRAVVIRRKRRGVRLEVATIRTRLVARADECCERCGVYCGVYGHAHHRIPRARGGTWTLANLEYLCPGCHLEAHLTNAL